MFKDKIFELQYKILRQSFNSFVFHEANNNLPDELNELLRCNYDNVILTKHLYINYDKTLYLPWHLRFIKFYYSVLDYKMVDDTDSIGDVLIEKLETVKYLENNVFTKIEKYNK